MFHHHQQAFDPNHNHTKDYDSSMRSRKPHNIHDVLHLLTSSSLQTQVVLEHAVHYSGRHAFQKLYPVINGSGLEAVTTEKFGFPRLHISLCNHRKVMTKLTLVAYLSCRSATRMNQESYTRIRVKINLNDADF